MRDAGLEGALMRLAVEVSELRSEVRSLRGLIRKTDRNVRWNMREIDDLKTADDAQTQAITGLTTAVTDATKKINDLAGQILSATDLATAKSVAQDILDHNASIAKAAADLETAVNPPTDGGSDTGTQTGT